MNQDTNKPIGTYRVSHKTWTFLANAAVSSIVRVCVNETFPHLPPLNTFNGDIYLNLSFLICAELLPLVKKNYFVIF